MNTYTTGEQRFADVAVEADGSFVVVWEEDDNNRDGSGFVDLRPALRRLRRPRRERVPGEHLHHRRPALPVGQRVRRRVASWSPGRASSGRERIRGVRPALRRLGERARHRLRRQHVHHWRSVQRGFGQVAHDARGNFVVTWQWPGRRQRLIQRPLSPSASAPRAPAAAPSSGSTPTPRISSAVRRSCPMRSATSSSPGRACDQDGGSYRSLCPAVRRPGSGRARVDTAGNQVLEPGETVDVRPAWRNVNGAAQTFSGTLDRHHRPRGRDLRDHRRRRRLRHGRRTARPGRAPTATRSRCPTRPRARSCTGTPRPWRASFPTRRASRSSGCCTSAAASPTCRAPSGFYRFVETLLHHGVTGGCSADRVLPGQRDHARADGGLRARGEGGSGIRAAGLRRDADVRRRAREQPLLPLDRGAGPARRGQRMRRRQLLPDDAAVTREQMAVFVLRTLDPRSTRRPARRPCTTTCPRPARSAAGSRS